MSVADHDGLIPYLEIGMTTGNRFRIQLASIFALGAMLAATSGCPKKTDENDLGDKTEEAAEDMGDKVEEVGD